MKRDIEFERCIEFLVKMIDKYGDEFLRELEEEKQINKENMKDKVADHNFRFCFSKKC